MVQAHPAVMSAEHHPKFFQRKNVQLLLPFLTSLAFHAGLIAIGLSVYQAVRVITVVRTEVGMPVDTVIDGDPDATPSINEHMLKTTGKDPTRETLQPFELDNIDPNSTKFTPGKALQINLNPGGNSEGDQADRSTLTFGPGGPKNGGGQGNGTGLGFGDGDGEAHDGMWGKAGPPGGGTIDLPPARRGARKIVYVCDATGSMTPVFSSLRQELAREIDKLRQTQFFNVIFFSDDKVLSLNQSLVQANPAGKTKAAAFFNDITSRGLTNPVPAIRAAFAQNPDVIYVLTDGFDQVNDLQSVVKEFDSLNKDRKVQVHTILIGSGEQKELAEVLRTIATQNNGVAKVVAKEDF